MLECARSANSSGKNKSMLGKIRVLSVVGRFTLLSPAIMLVHTRKESVQKDSSDELVRVGNSFITFVLELHCRPQGSMGGQRGCYGMFTALMAGVHDNVSVWTRSEICE